MVREEREENGGIKATPCLDDESYFLRLIINSAPEEGKGNFFQRKKEVNK